MPSQLHLLDQSAKRSEQFSEFPFFDRFDRKEDVEGLAGLPQNLPKYVPVDLLQVPKKVSNLEDALSAIRYCDKMCTLISVQSYCIKNTAFLKCALIEHTFVHVVPTPKPLYSQAGSSCIWRTEVRYALQLDVLILLQRIIEHFTASAMSIRGSKSFDATKIIVPGCIAAIADAVMRKKATDIPSEVSLHLMGFGGRGQPYGLSTGMFGSQSETIEVHQPELNLARTAIIDYFSDQQHFVPDHNQIFCWEKGQLPENSMSRFLSQICTELAFPQNDIAAYVSGEQHLIIKNYPEFECYRDIAFFFKYFMNTEAEAFPPVGNWTQKDAELNWKLSQNGYFVSAFGQMEVYCRPRNPEVLFTHRYPSVATPSFLTSPIPSKTEDDILHIRNLPTFDDVLGQRDSELLLSYLTVPYLRIPLVLTFLATEDRIHFLRSKRLQELVDAVLFEPGRFLSLPLGGILAKEPEPQMVPTANPEHLATPYGMLFNELHRSPDVIITNVLKLLKLALDLDTGTVYEENAVAIILFIVRLACRIENFMDMIVRYGRANSRASPFPQLRQVVIYPSILERLQEGLNDLSKMLRGPVRRIIQDWNAEAVSNSATAMAQSESSAAPDILDRQAAKNMESRADDDQKVDVNTRIACTMQAHLLLIYRNVDASEMSERIARDLVAASLFLTTRHTWNLKFYFSIRCPSRG